MSSTYRYFEGRKNELLARLRDLLEKEKSILLAIVFGSFAELDSYRDIDIDIAIYTPSTDLDYIAKLSARLELELNIPVDMVPLAEVPPRFKYNILTKEVIVLERVPGLYEALLNQTLDELHHENPTKETQAHQNRPFRG